MSKYGLDDAPKAKPVVAVDSVAGELRVQRNVPWLAVLNTLAIVGMFAVILLRDGGVTPPGPTPPPTPSVVITEDVESVTVEAERRFIKNKAEAAERLAKDITDGKITSSQHFGKMASEYQEAIERDAFAGMIELNQKYVRESSDKGWTPEQVKTIIELQRRKSAGYRSMLK
jgi:hypothetical protein